MEIISQSVGIDIAKESFTACICYKTDKLRIELTEVKKFCNDKKGFNQLTRWVGKSRNETVEINYVMEATGIYYEQLAHHLTKINKEVSVVLPNKVCHYGKSLNVKTKTDEDDAKVIAMIGCERRLRRWTAPLPIYKKLRAVCRLYKTIQDDKTQTVNRLKQIGCGHEPLREAIRFYKTTIKRLDKELKKLEGMMENILRSDAEVWAKVEKLLTIKGVGLKTAAIVIGETQGFALIKNQRQLTSYCGYDVMKRESGTSIKGKTRISKKGNSNIRSAMHFPAMVASRFNPKMKEIYERLLENNKPKKVALVALQRRLLVLMHALWKTNQPYYENHIPNKKSGFHVDEASSSSSTRRVEKEKVVGVGGQPTTQNEHLYVQASEALLRRS